MRNGTPGFRPARLAEAREARGLTQVSLAQLVGRASSSVSKWEAGEQSPEPDALDALARVLNVRTSWFLKATLKYGDSPYFYRSMTSETLGARKKAKARLSWLQEISTDLQTWIEFPAINTPEFQFNDFRLISDSDIERAAEKCRTHWNLGKGPISDVLLVLENAGILIGRDEIGTAKLDGLSHWCEADDRPYILLAKDKECAIRSRFDAAHELAHLVLHRHVDISSLTKKEDFQEIERQAHRFAGAFLLPAETFSGEIFYPSLNTFLALKERWKVSIAAMIMRCEALGIADGTYATRLWKHYSSRGWRKAEPLDDSFECERPRLLARAIRTIVENNKLTKINVLDELRLPASDVESLCELPNGYLSQDEAEVVALLPKQKTSIASESDNTATVVDFPSKKR